MSALDKKDPFLLFFGDVMIFFASLFIMLVIRYREMPATDLFLNHLVPFSFLFIVWLLVFFIAGLYEKRAVILRIRLPSMILQAEIANCIIAVLFFYFIPYFGITPKTNLFIYLAVSSVLILFWRLYVYPFLDIHRKQSAVLIGSGREMHELKEEVNSHENYNLVFAETIDLDAVQDYELVRKTIETIDAEGVSAIVIDFKNPRVEPVLPLLYGRIFSQAVFLDMYDMYEEIFDRIPLSLIGYSWFLENISMAPKIMYDALKRFMDVAIAFLLGVVSFVVYPFIYIAVKLDDGGPLFIVQERIGKDGKQISIVKFRTMTRNDAGRYGEGENRITKIGGFLRKSRLDELPQLWNVIAGDLSLIGPRPELPSLVALYEKEIPYYGVRHLIKPGLSGWAQIYHDNHPHHAVAVEATREKLSYDLYYLKNRSFILDIIITLKTIKKLLSRSGV